MTRRIPFHEAWIPSSVLRFDLKHCSKLWNTCKGFTLTYTTSRTYTTSKCQSLMFYSMFTSQPSKLNINKYFLMQKFLEFFRTSSISNSSINEKIKRLCSVKNLIISFITFALSSLFITSPVSFLLLICCIYTKIIESYKRSVSGIYISILLAN